MLGGSLAGYTGPRPFPSHRHATPPRPFDLWRPLPAFQGSSTLTHRKSYTVPRATASLLSSSSSSCSHWTVSTSSFLHCSRRVIFPISDWKAPDLLCLYFLFLTLAFRPCFTSSLQSPRLTQRSLSLDTVSAPIFSPNAFYKVRFRKFYSLGLILKWPHSSLVAQYGFQHRLERRKWLSDAAFAAVVTGSPPIGHTHHGSSRLEIPRLSPDCSTFVPWSHQHQQLQLIFQRPRGWQGRQRPRGR